MHRLPEARLILRGFVLLVVGQLTLALPQRVHSQDEKPAVSEQPNRQEEAVGGRPSIRFSFARAPWKDVFQALAGSANLSLHIGELPSGSFSYVDSRTYSPDEAIDRINLFLIPQRFVLVRSDELLSVISLDDEAGMRQLDVMAELVPLEELPSRSGRRIIKCLFPLADLSPEQAVQELSGLLLMRDPVLLRNTNQLLVTDTAGKLQLVERILTALSSTPGSSGPVRKIPLGELDVDAALAQVRPHVGLEPLLMTGPDISLSIDLNGRQLLVSGSREKVKVVEGVLKSLQVNSRKGPERAPRHFRPHPVGTADLQTVTSVLQTLLADEDVRLAPDAKSNQVALMATDDLHTLVDRTIRQLTSADVTEFKAIPLRSVDPRHAVPFLQGMYANRDADDGKPSAGPRPRIDADPATGRLLVRAKASQIAEIEHVLDQLGESGQPNESSLRLLPFRGERGRRILEAAQRFWPDSERLLILPAWESAPEDQPQEREITPDPERRDPERRKPAPASQSDNADSHPPRTSPVRSVVERRADSLRAQLTPQGILIQSGDLDELNRFEKHLRMIAGPEGSSRMGLAVFYLKHTTVDEADRLLRRWLETEAPGSSYDSSSGKAFVSASAGSFGAPTIFADSRLNRLFVHGARSDLDAIERHLKVIDREDSLTDVRTRGTPRVISLRHARAAEVAMVIRDAYIGRIAATAEERRQAVQLAQRQPQAMPDRRADQLPALPSPTAALPDLSEQPRMTLATDIQRNALIVTAPSQLADEVEQLALAMDRQSEKAVRLITTNRATATHVHAAVKNIFSDQVRGAKTLTRE